jgi:hypothetical protein
MAERVTISEFGYLYGLTFRQMRRGALWVPLLVQALLALGVLLMHYYIFSPVTGGIIRSVTNLINGDYAPLLFHYPAHFSLMPYFFGALQRIVNIFTEAFLFGIVIDLFLALYKGEKPILMTSVSVALKRYLQLTIVWFVVIGLLYLFNRFFPVFIEDVVGFSLQDAPRRRFMVEIIARGVTIIVYALCLFLLPSIIAGGTSLLGAVGRGLKVFLMHPFVAIGLVLIPYAVGFFPSWILSDPTKIVANFNPELVLYIIIFTIGLDVIVNFVMLGTALKFFMDRTS